MYEHHFHSKGNNGKRLGWLRNMWYSLIQQIVRQDPVYYALVVSLRPDKNWRLISYLYYTKYTSDGENTGFTHLDLIKDFMESGKGANIVQRGLSLIDETSKIAPLLPPGFKACSRMVQSLCKSLGENVRAPPPRHHAAIQIHLLHNHHNSNTLQNKTTKSPDSCKATCAVRKKKLNKNTWSVPCVPPLGIHNRCHPIWHTSIQIVEQLFRQRVPDFREDFYQSGSYSARATGGVSDVWVLLVKLFLEGYPDMFDKIEVWQ